MSTQVRSLLASGFGQTRYEPTAKRIRAMLGDATVLDSTRARLVWEPRRVVPSYAVPVEDVRAELVPAGPAAAAVTDDTGFRMPDVSSRPVLDPSIPFAVHTAEGQVVDLLAGGQSRPGAGFRVADAELAGYVVLDFSALDSYLPREEIRAELVPSSTRTYCAYKGQASYWSAALGGRQLPDIAWTYPDPLHDAAQVRDLIAFFTERIDVVLDGERLERPVTPWSARPAGY